MSLLLEAKDLTMRFGGLTAVSNFNLNMEKGDMVGLIGPNGAGKSTVFNMLCGFYKPTEGKVSFEGRDITGMKPHLVSSLGLVRVFQNGRLFKSMNVLENMMVSKHMRLKSSTMGAILRTKLYNQEEKAALDESINLLEQLGLTHLMYEQAGQLPFGIQRKLEVARALSTHPKLILLDEPATGLNIEETNDMMDFVIKLRKDFGLTIFLIEHTMRVVMGLCPNIIVIDHGETISVGCPDDVRKDQKVVEAYLGVDEDATN
jgi:branched-chain amino acid transport system ATP-binding protein